MDYIVAGIGRVRMVTSRILYHMSTHQDAILGWIVNHHHTVAPIRQPVTASRYSEIYLASATTIVESQNLCRVISSNAMQCNAMPHN